MTHFLSPCFFLGDREGTTDDFVAVAGEDGGLGVTVVCFLGVIVDSKVVGAKSVLCLERLQLWWCSVLFGGA